MNASTRKCSDSKPCKLMNCYNCRRRLIDETAIRLLETPGITQESVDQYRYGAINSLALEITPPSQTKAKARKGFTPKVGIDYQVIADKLRVCGDRGYAEQLLTRGRTVAELHHIWTLAGRTDRIPSRFRKDELVSHMIENLVGYRLDSDAIRTGAKS